MEEYIIVFGSYLNGVENAIGPFYSSYEAEKWLEDRPQIDGQTPNAKVIPLTRQ